MPIGTKNDLKVYDPMIRGGFVETLVQNLNAFNGASNGSIRLVSARKPGQFETESFFPMISGLVRQRDPNSTAAIADKKITQSEISSVKVDRGIGPVAMTLDSFRKAGLPTAEQSLRFIAGQMAAKAVVADYLNAAIRSLVGALDQGTSAKHVVPVGQNTGRMNTLALTGALAKFGDQSSLLGMIVMHSSAYFQLVDNQIVEKIVGISDFNIASGTPVTLNRPVLVTDADALLIKDPGTQAITGYRTLVLTPGAVVIEDTESEFLAFDLITGLENLAYRMQGEYAFNLGVKGFSWDKVNGGASPSDTALVTAGNWDAALADVKNRAGIMITSAI